MKHPQLHLNDEPQPERFFRMRCAKVFIDFRSLSEVAAKNATAARDTARD
jgi:hypothetical protein